MDSSAEDFSDNQFYTSSGQLVSKDIIVPLLHAINKVMRNYANSFFTPTSTDPSPAQDEEGSSTNDGKGTSQEINAKECCLPPTAEPNRDQDLYDREEGKEEGLASARPSKQQRPQPAGGDNRTARFQENSTSANNDSSSKTQAYYNSEAASENTNCDGGAEDINRHTTLSCTTRVTGYSDTTSGGTTGANGYMIDYSRTRLAGWEKTETAFPEVLSKCADSVLSCGAGPPDIRMAVLK